MLENFLLLKLNRGIWVALLNEEKIIEGIRYFEDYRENIIIASKTKKFKTAAHIELKKAEDIFIQILNRLANKYIAAEDYPNALICHTVLFQYEQFNIENIKKYIECLKRAEQYDLVIELVQNLENINSENIETYKLLAEMHDFNNNHEKAIEYMEKYIQSKGENSCSAEEINLLGCYYDKLYAKTYDIKFSKDAIRFFKKAHELNPYESCYLKNIIIMTAKTNDNITASKYWDILIKFENLSYSDQFDYACFCLKTKDFNSWYKYYDSRFKREENPVYFPKLSKPEWNGKKDLSNSTLLIHNEQGFGDTILMWGYIPKLKRLAKKIKFVVQNELYELLKDNNYGVKVIAAKDFNERDTEYDYYIPSMSIPKALNCTEKDISVGESFIDIDSELTEEYNKKYFNNNKIKIGISISGSRTGNTTRDIPIKELEKLDKLKNVEFYILTKDVLDESLNGFKRNKIINLAKEFRNFKDTAAAIKNLDLVITTDNCIMNLAGALGVKTYAIFNWSYESRWFDLSGENIVWLTSVKPFVNDKMDNWDYSINNIIQSINKILQ